MKKFTSQGKFLLTFLVALLSMLLTTSIAQAKDGWLTTFNSLYKTSNTRLDTCGACHVNFNRNSALNVYGEDFAAAGGRINQTAALQAIESNDPDGDGFSSLAEINSLFLPGWNCDNYGSAINAPKNVANFVDPDGCGVANAPDINLDPASLDFGVVTIGSPSVLTTQVQNLGNGDLEVTAIDLCIGTSTEFSFSPSESFTLVSGASQMLTVTYTPVNVGDDIGCMEIVSNDPDEHIVELGLTAAGKEPLPVVVDLEIAGFRVTKRISLRRVKPINLEVVVKNSGALDEPREATVVGVQNGIEVYNFSMMVSDPTAGGRTAWAFPDFTPDAAGNIVWTATINDNTRDVGAATATTTVVD